MPALVEPVTYKVGIGNEDGRVCYVYKDNNLVIATKLQNTLLQVTDIMVIFAIIFAGIITAWNSKLKRDEVIEENKHNEAFLFRYNIIANLKKRNQSMAAGIILGTYVLLRLPWFIASNVENLQLGRKYSIAYKVCGAIYMTRFSAVVILLMLTNKNYRRAFWDVIKPICPCYTLTNRGSFRKSRKAKSSNAKTRK